MCRYFVSLLWERLYAICLPDVFKVCSAKFMVNNVLLKAVTHLSCTQVSIDHKLKSIILNILLLYGAINRTNHNKQAIFLIYLQLI